MGLVWLTISHFLSTKHHTFQAVEPVKSRYGPATTVNSRVTHPTVILPVSGQIGTRLTEHIVLTFVVHEV